MSKLDNLSCLEIAKLFNEEESFKETVINCIKKNEQLDTIGYIIYAEDHEPMTDKQKYCMKKYGLNNIIELNPSSVSDIEY